MVDSNPSTPDKKDDNSSPKTTPVIVTPPRKAVRFENDDAIDFQNHLETISSSRDESYWIRIHQTFCPQPGEYDCGAVDSKSNEEILDEILELCSWFDSTEDPESDNSDEEDEIIARLCSQATDASPAGPSRRVPPLKRVESVTSGLHLSALRLDSWCGKRKFDNSDDSHNSEGVASNCSATRRRVNFSIDDDDDEFDLDDAIQNAGERLHAATTSTAAARIVIQGGEESNSSYSAFTTDDDATNDGFSGTGTNFESKKSEFWKDMDSVTF